MNDILQPEDHIDSPASTPTPPATPIPPGEVPFPPRARRTRKIPRHLADPTTEKMVPLTKLNRGIIRRLKTMDTLNEIAQEMKCSHDTVSRVYNMPAVQAYLRAGLEAAGAPHGKIFKRLAEGLDATQEDRAGGERPDFNQRHKTAMDCLRLQGLSAPPEAQEPGQSAGNIYNIVINAREARELEPRQVGKKPGDTLENQGNTLEKPGNTQEETK